MRHRSLTRSLSITSVFALLLSCGAAGVYSQASGSEPTGAIISPQSVADALAKIDALVEQNKRLENQNNELANQNRELINQMTALRSLLAGQSVTAPATVSNPAELTAKKPEVPTETINKDNQILAVEEKQGLTTPEPAIEVKPVVVAEKAEEKKSPMWGDYSPGLGIRVAETPKGDMRISFLTYGRYLNQLNLAPTYTNSFGTTSNVLRQNNFNMTKVFIKFLGWVVDPKFRYIVYAWTSNANQGQGAQVVLAGRMTYTFNSHITLGTGVDGLPGVRTTEGNWPYWLSVDARLIADEFFRPSYTFGVWAKGDITPKLKYMTMVGNNLSALGVSFAQLDGKPATTANALIWMPTTGEFGAGYGDFENHQKLAARVATHFSFSDENRQSQPSTESIENTQIRLTDGTLVFNNNLFGPGKNVNEVDYTMWDMDGGIKKRGISLEGEYYQRWLTNFRSTTGSLNIPTYFATGFQMQSSAMVIPKTLQAYVSGSKIFGPNGDPWDTRIGANWYPAKNRAVWWNNEFMYLSKSPVGYTSVPFAFGGKGWVYYSTFVLNF